jgi:hypothetical protein
MQSFWALFCLDHRRKKAQNRNKHSPYEMNSSFVTRFVGVIVVLILTIGGVIYFRAPLKEDIQKIAVILVGLFFVYRFATGWMSANVDISIEPMRVHQNDEEEDYDYLGVIVKLARGEYGTLQLGDAQLRITYLDSSPEPAQNLVGTKRLAHRDSKLVWGEESPNDPLNLHAKEKSEFAAAFRVPRKKVCTIEVILLTHRVGDGFEWFARDHWGQRRSSSVSLPLSDA